MKAKSAEGRSEGKREDEQEQKVRAIMERHEAWVHIGMWYIDGVKAHHMVKKTSTGKLDRRTNIAKLADELNQAIYGEALQP